MFSKELCPFYSRRGNISRLAIAVDARICKVIIYIAPLHERRLVMGSYIENDPAQQAKEAEAARKEVSLREKGYQAVVVKLGPGRKFTMLLHEPCGAYVGRPTAHDKACPVGK